MNKQTMNLLLLGLAGATAYLGYRFWQTQKAAKEAASASEDAAVLAANGEPIAAATADQQSQDAIRKAAGVAGYTVPASVAARTARLAAGEPAVQTEAAYQAWLAARAVHTF